MMRFKVFAINLLTFPVMAPFWLLYWTAMIVHVVCDIGVYFIVNPYTKFLRRIFKL